MHQQQGQQLLWHSCMQLLCSCYAVAMQLLCSCYAVAICGIKRHAIRVFNPSLQLAHKVISRPHRASESGGVARVRRASSVRTKRAADSGVRLCSSEGAVGNPRLHSSRAARTWPRACTGRLPHRLVLAGE